MPQRVQLHPRPDRWEELIDQLRTAPQSPLAQALNNPLTLTLVRDTYRAGDTVGELLDFCANAECTRESIVDHLLDRVLETAYTSPADASIRYSLHTAQRTLRLVAARMSQGDNQDLAWWRIPTWTPTLARVLTIGLISGLVGTLGHRVYLSDDPLIYSLGEGLVIGFGGMLGSWLASRKIPRTAPTRWHAVFSHPSLMFVLGMVVGYMAVYEYLVMFNNWLGLKHLRWLIEGFAAWLAVWILAGLAIWFAGKVRHPTAVNHVCRVHNHFLLVFVAGFGAGLVGQIETGAHSDWGPVWFGLVGLLVLGVGLGLGGSGRGSVSPLTPLASWSQDRAAMLGTWLMLALILGGFQDFLIFGSRRRSGLTMGTTSKSRAQSLSRCASSPGSHLD